MSNVRIGDLVLAAGPWVLVLEQNSFTVRGFGVGTNDPTDMVEVKRADITGLVPATPKTAEIAERMRTRGHRPSELAAVNGELNAIVTPVR